MALTQHVRTRATMPHGPTLAASLAPLLSPGGPTFHLSYRNGQVVIEQASFTGVNLTSVNSAIDSAPTWTAKLAAKDEVDSLSLLLRGAFLAMLDLMNVERARHSVAAVTPAAFLAQAKTKIDAL